MKLSIKILASAAILFAAISGASATEKENFSIRGIHVDLRTQVMTMDALRSLAKEVAEDGLNTMLLEWEATFPFEENATICNSHAYTKEEVRDFIAYAGSLGIEIIPIQHCFGHIEYVLNHERYAAAREGWNNFSQVCPLKTDECEKIFRSIFSEVAAMHPSKYFHIGADETRQLGECRECRAYLKNHSVSELYCNYISLMCKIVSELGKTPVIWGDILMKYPEAADNLPKDLIVMDWNYGWDIKFFGNIDNILKSGLKVWGATAMRSDPDNYYLVEWDKHLRNLTDYITYSRNKGYDGMINTSWSCSGSYGNAFETRWEVVKMIPEREVYPQSGFRMLIEAYGKAVTSTEPFIPEDFVKQYVGERFGFDEGQQQRMWEFFNTPQRFMKPSGNTRELIDSELENALKAEKMYKELKPKSNKMEFEHLRLMTDIRINYLKYMQICALYESDEYHAPMAAGLAAQLKPLVKEQAGLQKRFCKLNATYLKAPQDYYGSWDYSLKMKELYRTLSNN